MGATEHADQLEGWILNVDGASSSRGRIKIVLTTLKGSIIEQSFTIGFPASNNEAEYETILAGLRAVITQLFGFTRLEVQCDFSLAVNQISGECHKGFSDGKVPTTRSQIEV